MKFIDNNKLALAIWGTKRGMQLFLSHNIADSNLLIDQDLTDIRGFVNQKQFFSFKQGHDYYSFSVVRTLLDWVGKGRPGFLSITLFIPENRKADSIKIQELLIQLISVYWDNYVESSSVSNRINPSLEEELSIFLEILETDSNKRILGSRKVNSERGLFRNLSYTTYSSEERLNDIFSFLCDVVLTPSEIYFFEKKDQALSSPLQLPSSSPLQLVVIPKLDDTISKKIHTYISIQLENSESFLISSPHVLIFINNRLHKKVKLNQKGEIYLGEFSEYDNLRVKIDTPAFEIQGDKNIKVKDFVVGKGIHNSSFTWKIPVGPTKPQGQFEPVEMGIQVMEKSTKNPIPNIDFSLSIDNNGIIYRTDKNGCFSVNAQFPNLNASSVITINLQNALFNYAKDGDSFQIKEKLKTDKDYKKLIYRIFLERKPSAREVTNSVKIYFRDGVSKKTVGHVTADLYVNGNIRLEKINVSKGYINLENIKKGDRITVKAHAKAYKQKKYNFTVLRHSLKDGITLDMPAKPPSIIIRWFRFLEKVVSDFLSIISSKKKNKLIFLVIIALAISSFGLLYFLLKPDYTEFKKRIITQKKIALNFKATKLEDFDEKFDDIKSYFSKPLVQDSIKDAFRDSEFNYKATMDSIEMVENQNLRELFDKKKAPIDTLVKSAKFNFGQVDKIYNDIDKIKNRGLKLDENDNKLIGQLQHYRFICENIKEQREATKNNVTIIKFYEIWRRYLFCILGDNGVGDRQSTLNSVQEDLAEIIFLKFRGKYQRYNDHSSLPEEYKLPPRFKNEERKKAVKDLKKTLCK